MSITIEDRASELVAMIEASINPGYREGWAIAKWIHASKELEAVCARSGRATSARVKEMFAERISFRLVEVLAAEKAAGRLAGQ